MNEIIKKGIDNAIKCGVGGEFFERQFIFTHAEWIQKMFSLFNYSENTIIVRDDEYVWVYSIDSRGNYNSLWFTTAQIAGAIRQTLTADEPEPTGKVEFEERDGWMGDIVASVQDADGLWHICVMYTLPAGTDVRFSLFEYDGWVDEKGQYTVGEFNGILLRSYSPEEEYTTDEEYWKNMIRAAIE